VTMTKRELVIQVANKLGMTQSDVAKIIEGIFETISQTLAEGKRWELRDFGVFEVKTRASRIGRNPRTGQQVPVPERRVVTFRPGKKMKELIAAGTPISEPAPSTAPVAFGSPGPAQVTPQPGSMAQADPPSDDSDREPPVM